MATMLGGRHPVISRGRFSVNHDVTVGIEDLTYGLDPILILLGPCNHEPLSYRLERTIIKVIKQQADSIDYSLA
jgi:hypothetical protein